MPSLGRMFNLNTRLIQNIGKYVLCTLALLRVVLPEDLCATSSYDYYFIASKIHEGVAPRGRASAGKFYKDSSVTDFVSCVESCCKDEQCNVAFFPNQICYLITCNASWPQGCEPENRTDGSFRDALWLTLRPLVSEKSDEFNSPLPSSDIPVPFESSSRKCDSDSDCDGESEECRAISESSIKRCVCAPGFVLSTTTQRCVKSSGVQSRPCSVGLLDDCRKNEVCVPKNSRSRVGICMCRDGYSRRFPGGPCFLDAPTDQSTLKQYSTTYRTSTPALPTYSQTSLSSSASSESTTTSALKTIDTKKPPVAKVKPDYQEIHQPSDLLIDGSGSSDDAKIASYYWEVVSKPIDSALELSASSAIQSTLFLKGLSPGFYRFRLTVTDSDGLKSSAFANVTVIKETDNPPVANAGDDIVVDLPVATATLNGNASHDDKQIVTYEWSKKSSDNLAVDMEGVRTPFLKLSNLQAGVYTFTLRVTDSSGQVNAADVHVLVRPEQNQPPIASAGPNQTVSLAAGIITLNGSGSYDDKKIESYSWTLLSGPSPVDISNPHNAVATVSKLTAGQYVFQLTVNDKSGLTSSAITTVTVKEGVNRPPVAKAGGNLVFTIPVDVIRINGSLSTDDNRITSFTWTRDKSSPAAGDVLYNSDHEPVLQLINVVSGRYAFTLEVKDEEGLSSRDTMSLIVRPDPLELNLIGLHLATDAKSFTDKDKALLIDNLSLLLGKFNSSGTTRVVLRSLVADETSGLTLVTFYVETLIGNKHVICPGTEVVASLKKIIPSSHEIFDSRIVQFDTVVCQNNCSGHGTCDQTTRRCQCNSFWMENFVKAHFFEQQSNCDWSIIYVVLVIAFCIILTAAILCFVIWVAKRCICKPKLKRHRYMLLEERNDDDDDEYDVKCRKNVKLVPKGRSQNSSLMQSESDFSSEETIFQNNKRPVNGSAGKLSNGSARRSKVTA